MKLEAALIILFLVGAVCAQEDDNIFWGIFRAFCDNVQNGKSCRLPQAFDKDVVGVCCNGLCHFGTKNCRIPMDEEKANEIYQVFQRYVCRQQGEGDACVIPQSVSNELGYNLKGACCDGLCRYGIKSCGSFCGDGVCTDRERRDGNCMEDCSGGTWDICGDGVCSDAERSRGMCQDDCGEYVREDRPRKDDMDVEEQMKALKLMTCLGVDEGGDCNLPADLDEEFGLTGVCCGGECNYRKTNCGEIGADKPDLIVSSIEVIPGDPREDEKVDVTVKVENIGEGSTEGGFWILLEIFEGETLLTEENHEVDRTMESGDFVKYTFKDKLGVGREGSYRIKAEADMNSNFDHQSNLIEEGNEDNNGGSKMIYVAAAVDEDKDICGDGQCYDREKTDGSCHEDCVVKENQNGLMPDEVLALLALIFGFAVVVAIIIFLIRSKKKVSTTGMAAPKSIEELQGEKDELEKMMAIAKGKYHKRELDEESFREIIRDNQKKVIELELKIRAYEP